MKSFKQHLTESDNSIHDEHEFMHSYGFKSHQSKVNSYDISKYVHSDHGEIFRNHTDQTWSHTPKQNWNDNTPLRVISSALDKNNMPLKDYISSGEYQHTSGLKSGRTYHYLNSAKYLYHGTSDVHLEGIKKHGFKPKIDKYDEDREHKTYVTTDPQIAANEAISRVKGENWEGGKKASGGNPVVIALHKNHPSIKNAKFRHDSEYDENENPNYARTLYTNKKIHKDAIAGHFNVDVEKEKHSVPKQYDQKFHPKVDESKL